MAKDAETRVGPETRSVSPNQNIEHSDITFQKTNNTYCISFSCIYGLKKTSLLSRPTPILANKTVTKANKKGKGNTGAQVLGWQGLLLLQITYDIQR